VIVSIEGQFSFPPEVKVALYRIAQEALNNVSKHAGARQANVNLLCESDKITLKITDDGRGFDMTGVPSDSLGLGIMRERAEDILASLSVQSRTGQGTEVMVVWQNVSRESKQ
jgi:signal transduction histidine kinase